MENALNPENLSFYFILFGAIVLTVIMAWFGFHLWARKSVERKLRATASDMLLNFLVPDGLDSEIHVQYALLTHRGIIVVDVRDIAGNVFGSDSMEEWTVLSERRRFTFPNPQHSLLDRIAAVKRLLPDVPVEGFVVFTDRAQFTKGRPTHVRMLDRLVEELIEEKRDAPPDAVADFKPQWNQLREVVVQTAASV